ncbi:MAG: DnaA N-terminal domain-containing protein, partial [Porticoccaceae bacterium]
MELSNSFEHGSLGGAVSVGVSEPMDFNALQAIWSDCSKQLSDELPPQQFNTWIRPLKIQFFAGDAALSDASSTPQRIQLVAPNRFIEDWVQNKFL